MKSAGNSRTAAISPNHPLPASWVPTRVNSVGPPWLLPQRGSQREFFPSTRIGSVLLAAVGPTRSFFRRPSLSSPWLAASLLLVVVLAKLSGALQSRTVVPPLRRQSCSTRCSQPNKIVNAPAPSPKSSVFPSSRFPGIQRHHTTPPYHYSAALESVAGSV